MNTATIETAMSGAPATAISARERTALEMGCWLIHAGAVAANLQCGFLLTDCIEGACSSTLTSLEQATSRLKAARAAADTYNVKIKVVVCTEGKRATAINSDQDMRDRRYLTGLTNDGGDHGYCGSFDAAIERSLVLATYADVVCYMSRQFDLFEAKEFAVQIRAAFPGKELGFGHSSQPNSTVAEDSRLPRAFELLRRLGYDYYFHAHSGGTVFQGFPADDAWVMFDDSARARSPQLSAGNSF